MSKATKAPTGAAHMDRRARAQARDSVNATGAKARKAMGSTDMGKRMRLMLKGKIAEAAAIAPLTGREIERYPSKA